MAECVVSVFGLILAFTAGSEAKPESPAVNRPAPPAGAAWNGLHFTVSRAFYVICMVSVFVRLSP